MVGGYDLAEELRRRFLDEQLAGYRARLRAASPSPGSRLYRLLARLHQSLRRRG